MAASPSPDVSLRPGALEAPGASRLEDSAGARGPAAARVRPGRTPQPEGEFPALRPVERAPSTLLGRRGLQVALGLLWLFDGALALQPYMAGRGLAAGVLAPNAAGQPHLVGVPIIWAAHLVAQHPAIWSAEFAVIQLVIGAGLLCRRTVRPALIASFVWALSVWWLAEGFGMLLTGSASPLTGAPGQVLLYALIGMLAWPRQSSGADRPVSDTSARLAWLVLWSGCAVVWLLPANRRPGSVRDAIGSATPSQPAWLAGVLTGAAQAASGHGLAIAATLAAVSLAIGVGVLTRRGVLYVLMGVGLSLVLWVVGQGLGGILTGQGTDPNSGPLFVLLGMALIPRVRRSKSTLPADPPPVNHAMAAYDQLLAQLRTPR